VDDSELHLGRDYWISGFAVPL